MKIDFYTKTVLTIIALCLVLLTLDNLSFFGDAKASVNEYDIESALSNQTLEVKIVGWPYSDIPVEIRRTVPVKIEDFRSSLDVKVR